MFLREAINERTVKVTVSLVSFSSIGNIVHVKKQNQRRVCVRPVLSGVIILKHLLSSLSPDTHVETLDLTLLLSTAQSEQR